MLQPATAVVFIALVRLTNGNGEMWVSHICVGTSNFYPYVYYNTLLPTWHKSFRSSGNAVTPRVCWASDVLGTA